MDRNYITGIALLLGLLFIWIKINEPTQEELDRYQFVQDSLARVTAVQSEKSTTEAEVKETEAEMPNDSSTRLALTANYGDLAEAMQGESKDVTIENNLMRVVFNTAGAQITQVWLKDYKIMLEDSLGEDSLIPLTFMDNPKDEFSIDLHALIGKSVPSSQLYFESKKTADGVEFSAPLGNGVELIQSFRLPEGSYALKSTIQFLDPNKVLGSADWLDIKWTNVLKPLEKNVDFEKMYSTIYYHEVEDGTDYCSCRGEDLETMDRTPIKWVTHSNQFFSSAIIGEKTMQGMEMRIVDPENDNELKKLTSQFKLALDGGLDGKKTTFDLYIGPNEYDILRSYDKALADVIPYGWSIFGTINRYVIRPLFSFLSSFIGSMGLVILALTIIVKFVVYPLTYKMLYSQSKMAALKPVVADLKDKHKDDAQQQQMETMKVYREYGVSPLGGCFPMALQMPIWFALYRFFPASIEFRQASFLWANDLSSYDAFIHLPMTLPIIGNHISLFTLLWVISLEIYTYYNSQTMDMTGANPMMKNMQYLMPLMFFFFLNNYASGLTCYLLFSNTINIIQTVGTKNYIIDQEKIKDQLNANKANPKKRSKFQQRLEDMMREQQKAQDKKKSGKK